MTQEIGAAALRLAWETPSRVVSLTLFEPVAFHQLAAILPDCHLHWVEGGRMAPISHAA